METKEPQIAGRASCEKPEPLSLVEWSKTPEFKEGWMKKLAENEAKPPIYSPGHEGSEPTTSEKSNPTSDLFTWMKTPEAMQGLKDLIDKQNAELTVEALTRKGLI